MSLDKKLLDLLVCPQCKGTIHLNKAHSGLICSKCHVKYPIKDDIPVMLIDEAIKLDRSDPENS